MRQASMRPIEGKAPFRLGFESFLELPAERRRSLLFQHRLLALKSAKPLKKARIKRALALFGALYKNPPGGERFFVDGDPEAMRVSNNDPARHAQGLFHNFSLNWHQDFSHTPGDFHGSALYNRKNGHKAGFYFIDTCIAFRALPARLRKQHKSASLLHCVQEKAFLTKLKDSERRLLKIKKFNIKGHFSPSCLNGGAARPLFPAHPVTGERSIYLSPATANPQAIGEKDFEEILSFCLPFTKQLVFEDFDLLLFDNLSIMHRRDGFSGERELHRFQFDYSKALKRAGGKEA